MENTLTVNNELIVSYAAGFHILTKEEREKLNLYKGTAGECLSDPERHIMIAFGYKPAGFIFKALYSAKDFAKYMEKKIERLMKPYGYRQKGSCTKMIENETAEGFRYEYEAQNIGMYAESYVVKHGKFFLSAFLCTFGIKDREH